MVVDEEMRERHHLQWTRNLVESNRRKVLNKLHVVDGVHVFEV